jgi:hypothetical protein
MRQGFNRNQNSQNMRDVWMSSATHDRTAFQLTLANAALHLANRTGETETTESIGYYTIAARMTEQRLQSPDDSISDGVIVTVLGFACHDVSNISLNIIVFHFDTTCSMLFRMLLDGNST